MLLRHKKESLLYSTIEQDYFNNRLALNNPDIKGVLRLSKYNTFITPSSYIRRKQ